MRENPSATRTARASAALVIALAPVMLLASALVSRALGRGLLAAGAAAATCLVAAAVLLSRGARPRSQAGLLVTGAACVLGGGGYMWSVRNVPSAIPIGGFLAIVRGLVLLAIGALTLRATPTDAG